MGLLLMFKNKYDELSLSKKSVIWFTLATIIQNGILFLVTPIYTRMLTGDEYGVYSVYQSWQQIISIISILALDRCITVGFVKFSNKRKEFLSSIQTLMTVLVFIFSMIVCIFPTFFEKIINLPMYIIIMMFFVSLMNSSLANWSWLQRYNYNYKKLTFVTISTTIIMQLVSIFCIYFIPFDNKGILLIVALSGTRLMMYGIIYVSVFIKGKKIYNKEYWNFSLKYSIAVVPHALAQIILNSSDRIMIDKICGRSDAAYYGVTYSAAMVLNTIATSISSAVQPWYFEKIKNRDYTSIKSVTNNLLLFSATLSIVISLFAPEILSIMAPPDYKAALWVFPSIAASVYFNSMYLYFANFESYFEKPIYFSIATSTGAIVNVILNLIFIQIFGFIAAGYTTLFCYILFAIMHYIFMRKVCKEFLGGVQIFDLKFILILSILVIFATLGIVLLYHNILLRYILIIIFIVLLFVKKNLFLEHIKNKK